MPIYECYEGIEPPNAALMALAEEALRLIEQKQMERGDG